MERIETSTEQTVPQKSEYELIQEVYPFKTCHEVYELPFEDVYTDKEYINHLCMVCKSIDMENLDYVYRCRHCLIVMCPNCGQKNPREPYEKTKKIRDESCGKYQLSETTAKTLFPDADENSEDIKCDTCQKEIGFLKFGDYIVAKCKNCAKNFCQFCKNKHVDPVNGPKLVIFEELQRSFCSRKSIKNVFCKQYFVGMQGDVGCTKCGKLLGTVSPENYDFKICICVACNAKLCGNCTWEHKDTNTDLRSKLAQIKYQRDAEKNKKLAKKAEIDRLRGPKCGSQHVIRTPHGKQTGMIFCQNCKKTIYSELEFGDKKSMPLFKCGKCDSFLCEDCKYHWNQEELEKINEKEEEEKKIFSTKMCTSDSLFLTTARTLYGASENNVVIKCGSCDQLIGNSEDAKDQDYNIYKCRICGKDICSDCSGSHSSQDLQTYLSARNAEKNKFEGEIIAQMENRRFQAPCCGKTKVIEPKELYPSSANKPFKVNCVVCGTVVSNYVPGYVANDVTRCVTCNDILCDACLPNHKTQFRNDCKSSNVGKVKASYVFPDDKNSRYDVLCAVCKKHIEKQEKEDPGLFYCGNCLQVLCDGCAKNHNGQFFASRGQFQPQEFVCGPTSCTMYQAKNIDSSVKCGTCGGCAINDYGEYFKCSLCKGQFCEKCKKIKPEKRFLKSERDAQLLSVPVKDPSNCGSDMTQIEAFKARVADYFDCNYKHCGERVKVTKDTLINRCNRCKKIFCKQCASNHCTPEAKEYQRYLVNKGKEFEEFLKAQKEYEQARAAYYKKKKEEEEKKKQEEKEKMKKAAEDERKKQEEMELNNIKDEEERKRKEEEMRQAEEERKIREEEQRKEDERRKAEEARLKASCGSHSTNYVPSTFKKFGKCHGDKWEQGLAQWICSVCSCTLASKNEDYPCYQCTRCWRNFCTTHGPEHKS